MLKIIRNKFNKQNKNNVFKIKSSIYIPTFRILDINFIFIFLDYRNSFKPRYGARKFKINIVF